MIIQFGLFIFMAESVAIYRTLPLLFAIDVNGKSSQWHLARVIGNLWERQPFYTNLYSPTCPSPTPACLPSHPLPSP